MRQKLGQAFVWFGTESKGIHVILSTSCARCPRSHTDLRVNRQKSAVELCLLTLQILTEYRPHLNVLLTTLVKKEEDKLHFTIDVTFFQFLLL